MDEGWHAPATATIPACVGLVRRRQIALLTWQAAETTAPCCWPTRLASVVLADMGQIIDIITLTWQVADKHNAVLLADMAHISGLVAAGVVPSPFE